MLKITGTTLLKTYLYLISFITLTVAVFTGAIVFKSTLSYIAPLYFSYNLDQVNKLEDFPKESDIEFKECYEGEVIGINQGKYCWNEDDRKQDIINGTTTFISMLILFGLHQLGINRTKQKKTPKWIIKAYTIISLLTYSITGIIAIPTSIYLTVNYLLLEKATENLEYAPAYAIGLVILILPLWYIFFNKTLKLKDD